MMKMSRTLLNRPILSLRAGTPVGTAIKPIINPADLKILGWYCSLQGDSNKVLLTSEVREFLPDGLVIDDHSALSSPDDLVRVKNIVDDQFTLVDKVVKTKRQKLGKVQDYAYNDGWYIQKIYVTRSLINVWTNNDTLIIDRTQILEITDTYILVSDTDIGATEVETQSNEALGTAAA